MDKTQEIIKEQLRKLPQNIRDAISSIDLGDKIRKIADKNMLHIDQAGDLETETVLVMLGLEPTADYKENIRRELNISRDRAQTITADIDKEIFMTIRESLKRINPGTETKQESEAPKEIHPVRSNPPDADANQQADRTSYGIHHPPLDESDDKPHLVTPPLSEPLSDESEEIKRQVAQQKVTKPIVVPPPNLPIQPARQNFAGQNLSGQAEPKESHLEARPISEEKKPTHIDPYREPIE